MKIFKWLKFVWDGEWIIKNPDKKNINSNDKKKNKAFELSSTTPSIQQSENLQKECRTFLLQSVVWID